MIEDSTIEEIRERTDIVDLVSNYVELKRAGSNFKALCPFHEEKTPSFIVSPQKQIFHCFGCNRGGNVFAFVMEMEGVSFPEAVRTLGRKCGVEVAPRSAARQEKESHESLYAANEFAARWYHRNLMERPSGREARDYLESRGVERSLWVRFRLGATGNGWDDLFKAARKGGIEQEAITRLKLVARSDRAAGYYDYFRRRLIFPITTASGRVVAFAGRVLGDGEPKYINSAESPIFAKRKTLYGMEQSRSAIAKAREVLLVEGYLDCIALHGVGFSNAVASCGTALTSEHASVLRRLTRRIVVFPDGDEAGWKAALTSGAILAAAGLEARIAPTEEGEDPDSVVRKGGGEAVSAIVAKAMDYFQFLNYIINKPTLSLAEREELVRRVVDGFSACRDELRMEMLLRELARAANIDGDVLREKAAAARGYRLQQGRKSPGTAVENSRFELEKMTLKLLMVGGEVSEEAFTKLDAEDFTGETTRELYKLLDSSVGKDIDLESSEFQKAAEKAGAGGLAAEIALIPIPPGDTARLLKDHVKRMKEFKIRDELEALSREMGKFPEGSEEAIAMAEYYNKLKIALAEL